MVKVAWLGQFEQGLKQPLDRCRGPQVRAAYNDVHAAGRIVDDAGEVVARRRILPREDRLADVRFACGELRPVSFFPTLEPGRG